MLARWPRQVRSVARWSTSAMGPAVPAGRQGLPQPRQVPGPRGSQRHAGQDALHVADAVKQSAAARSGDPPAASPRHSGAAAGCPGPAAGGSASGGAGVRPWGWRSCRCTPGRVFSVPPAKLMSISRLRRLAASRMTPSSRRSRLQLADMGQGGALGIARILQQAARGADGQRSGPRSRSRTRSRVPSWRDQQALGAVGLEMPGRLAAHPAAFGEQRRSRSRPRSPGIRRAQPRQFIARQPPGRSIPLPPSGRC